MTHYHSSKKADFFLLLSWQSQPFLGHVGASICVLHAQADQMLFFLLPSESDFCVQMQMPEEGIIPTTCLVLWVSFSTTLHIPYCQLLLKWPPIISSHSHSLLLVCCCLLGSRHVQRYSLVWILDNEKPRQIIFFLALNYWDMFCFHNTEIFKHKLISFMAVLEY